MTRSARLPKVEASATRGRDLGPPQKEPHRYQRRAPWARSACTALDYSFRHSPGRTETWATGSARHSASVPETASASRSSDSTLAARTSVGRLLRSRTFWAQRSLHPIARLVLLAVVVVLLCIAIGFIVESGEFTRYDLLAVMFYAGLAAFAWHPTTAAFIIMLISSMGVVFTRSGGDLLELAVALCLVAVTCAPWVIALHAVLLGVLTSYIAAGGSTLAEGGIYGIAGIAVIAFLAGIAFRLVAAREEVLVSERARVVQDLELIAREEQERIADELHDGIAHDLTLVLFHARALPRQPDEAARQVSLTTIEESAEQALRSIQSLLAIMRDTAPDAPQTSSRRYDGKAIEAATSLGALLTDAGIATRVSVPVVPLDVAPATEQVMTETAIEAVTNILKHAPKSHSASIELRQFPDDSRLELVVENAWQSAPSRQRVPSSGRGLARARQRIEQLGGHMESGEAEDKWFVRATAPSDAII